VFVVAEVSRVLLGVFLCSVLHLIHKFAVINNIHVINLNLSREIFIAVIGHTRRLILGMLSLKGFQTGHVIMSLGHILFQLLNLLLLMR